jgi:membrane-associated phospholipid phosphatase
MVFCLVCFAFWQLSILVPALNPNDFSRALEEVDRSFLGFGMRQPPRVPLVLADVLQIAYGFFYCAPLLVLAGLAKRGQAQEINRCASLHAMAFYTSFVVYFLVPARSPYRATSVGLQIDSLLFSQWLRDLIHRLEVFEMDCFPSGHVLVGLATVFSSFRWYRKLAPWLLIWFVVQVFALIALGYHYVVDLLAAFALAPTCLALSQSELAREESEADDIQRRGKPDEGNSQEGRNRQI